MVCDDVRRVVYFYLDGTLSEQKSRILVSHLEHCADCEQRVLLHRRIRSFVRNRLQPLTAPAHLRERLSGSFRQLRTGI